MNMSGGLHTTKPQGLDFKRAWHFVSSGFFAWFEAIALQCSVLIEQGQSHQLGTLCTLHQPVKDINLE